MRFVTVLLSLLSILGLAACAASGDDSEQTQRHQSGPYVGASGGVGF